jgi:pimeloyl-ACP methyl ester carboxylesterase
MPTIDYDPTDVALYQPGNRRSPFLDGLLRLDDLNAVCAECSRLAYVGFERDADERARLVEALGAAGLKTFQEILDPATDTQAFATTWTDGRPLVAFRGTERNRPTDLRIDADAFFESWPDGVRVHRGFARAYKAVEATVTAVLAKYAGLSPIFTGHSLGAALATLAASRIPGSTLVTFGSPRVGNAAFAELVKRVGNFRHVDCCDLVTRVPPSLPNGYVHCGDAIYIDRNGVIGEVTNADDIDVDRRTAAGYYFLHHALASGDVKVRELADHAPINYIRAFT